MELMDSGYSPEEIQIFEMFSKAAESLAPKLKIEQGKIWQAFNKIYEDYQWNTLITENVEQAKQAKIKLRNLASKADELAEAMLALGQGAIEVICRPTTCQKLIEVAEPSNLPDPRPWGNRYGAWFGPPDNGPWITRLRALSELARAKANRIEEKTKKGGRISFGARIHGSPEDLLARDCKNFAVAHGCQIQAVVLQMVQVIMEAEHGKKWMERKKDTKRSPDKGRKAVRKLAQTNPKAGSI
jgi:hypothetical protein